MIAILLWFMAEHSRPTGSMPPSPKSPETLRAIESLLLWEGTASNERVREVFDLHFTTVSRLLTQYAELNPAGLSYSTAQKRWVAGPDFRPMLTAGSIDEYLAYTLPERQGPSPAVLQTHLDFGRVQHRDFAVLHRAIRERRGVSVEHRSLRNPTPASKTFYPHTLIEAGRRWHVRAYVPAAGEFQDLALTRMSKLQLTELNSPEEADQMRDDAWTTQVPLRMVPHPHLTAEQKQVVRAEYFGGSAARVELVRAALLPYVIHELRAATDPNKQIPPDFQLCVDGMQKFSKWLLPQS